MYCYLSQPVQIPLYFKRLDPATPPLAPRMTTGYHAHHGPPLPIQALLGGVLLGCPFVPSAGESP